MTRRMRGQEFYIVEELLDIIPVSSMSIRAYLRSGRLKGVKIGRVWYIPRVEVDRFLDPRYQEEQKSLKEAIQS